MQLIYGLYITCIVAVVSHREVQYYHIQA